LATRRNQHALDTGFYSGAPQATINAEDVTTEVQRRIDGASWRSDGISRWKKGLWFNGEGAEDDEVIIIEVMVDTFDRAWWRQYHGDLEQLRRQDELLVRAHLVEAL
jgi:hypothetical protein